MKHILKKFQILTLLIFVSCKMDRTEYTMTISKEETILSAEYQVMIDRLNNDSAKIFFAKQAKINSKSYLKDSIHLPINSEIIKYSDMVVKNINEIRKEKEKNRTLLIMDDITYKFYIKQPGEKTDSLSTSSSLIEISTTSK
jgi:hypothetical protein